MTMPLMQRKWRRGERVWSGQYGVHHIIRYSMRWHLASVCLQLNACMPSHDMYTEHDGGVLHTWGTRFSWSYMYLWLYWWGCGTYPRMPHYYYYYGVIRYSVYVFWIRHSRSIQEGGLALSSDLDDIPILCYEWTSEGTDKYMYLLLHSSSSSGAFVDTCHISTHPWLW